MQNACEDKRTRTSQKLDDDKTLINESSSSTNIENPIITIITAVFNGVKHIESTILSVLNLEHECTINYIIIDGGSNDGTVDIIRKYSSKIHYWISEPDNGIYDAFNKGWNAANSESFILYLGAGDKIISLPDKLPIGNDAIYGRVMIKNGIFFNSVVDFRLRLGNTLHHQALLIKKRISPDPPFNTMFTTYADFDFNQRLLKQNAAFHFDGSFTSYALPGGVSERFKIKESLQIVRKNFGFKYQVLACIYYFMQHLMTLMKLRF